VCDVTPSSLWEFTDVPPKRA